MIKRNHYLIILSLITSVTLANNKIDKESIAIETAMPTIDQPKKKYRILCFSKAYGFPHASIHTAKKMIQIMARATPPLGGPEKADEPLTRVQFIASIKHKANITND